MAWDQTKTTKLGVGAAHMAAATQRVIHVLSQVCYGGSSLYTICCVMVACIRGKRAHVGFRDELWRSLCVGHTCCACQGPCLSHAGDNVHGAAVFSWPVSCHPGGAVSARRLTEGNLDAATESQKAAINASLMITADGGFSLRRACHMAHPPEEAGQSSRCYLRLCT